MKSEETKRTRENFEMLMQDMFEVNLPESFSKERSNTVSSHNLYILIMSLNYRKWKYPTKYLFLQVSICFPNSQNIKNKNRTKV